MFCISRSLPRGCAENIEMGKSPQPTTPLHPAQAGPSPQNNKQTNKQNKTKTKEEEERKKKKMNNKKEEGEYQTNDKCSRRNAPSIRQAAAAAATTTIDTKRAENQLSWLISSHISVEGREVCFSPFSSLLSTCHRL